MDERDAEKERQYYVIYAKEFVQTVPFQLPTVQLKMLLYVISQIKYDHDSSHEYVINIRDMSQVCGIKIDGGNNYSKVKKDWEMLFKHEFRKLNKQSDVYETFAFFDKCKVEGKKGIVTLVFSCNVAQYFFHQQGNYVQHMLQTVIPFTSVHSIRLMMLIQSYLYKEKLKLQAPQKIRISIDQIKTTMMLGTAYESWGNLKRRIIEASIMEINEKSDEIYLQTEYIRDRRTNKMSTIIFTVYPPSIEQKENARKIRKEYFEQKI